MKLMLNINLKTKIKKIKINQAKNLAVFYKKQIKIGRLILIISIIVYKNYLYNNIKIYYIKPIKFRI